MTTYTVKQSATPDSTGRKYSAMSGVRTHKALRRLVGWLEFNVPFQHKYGYIRDEHAQTWIIQFYL